MYQNYKTFAILLWIFLKDAEAISRIDPLVDTKLGMIRGQQSSDGQYSMFMGIPYATVDELNPFGPSTPHQGFNEVFEANDDSAICPQIEEFNKTFVGSFDCLHLNIYVPNTAGSQNKLPVLVWIYGGGFNIGFSGRYVYGPSFLVKHDIILVTLNYRLGPYGFMCLDNPEVSGNQGLKDQRIALKWVKDHIEAFGGDANKITIFGESAGATSVALHMYYQKEKLFDKVIMQSGYVLSPIALPGHERSPPLALAEYLGFRTNNESDALAFLTQADISLVIGATAALDIYFTACVEKQFDGVEIFIDEHPYTAPLPNLSDIPILIGFNNRESLADINNKENLQNENVFGNFLTDYFNLKSDEKDEIEKLIRHFYIGDDGFNDDSMWYVMDFNADYKFNHPSERIIQKCIENGAQNIYHYMFSYDGSRNFVKHRLNITEEGAAHADEISYLFDVSYMTDAPTPADQITIDRMTSLWSNFVKFGNPTPETSELLPVIWTPVSQDELFYLDIDEELSVKQRAFHARMAFWDLFYKLYETAQKGYLNNEIN